MKVWIIRQYHTDPFEDDHGSTIAILTDSHEANMMAKEWAEHDSHGQYIYEIEMWEVGVKETPYWIDEEE